MFVGNTVGQVFVVDVETLKIVPFQNYHPDKPFHISGDVDMDLKSKHVLARLYNINQLEFSKCGTYLAVNTGFSIFIFIITFNESKGKSVDFISIGELKNAITNDIYTVCKFSGTISNQGDSAYLIAANVHKVLIYDCCSGGELVKILECPFNENIISLDWHPQNFKYLRPIIVTSTRGGNVFFWTKHLVENWSAFSPDFDEIEANEMYIERENEYDNDCEEEISTVFYHDETDPNVVVDISSKPAELQEFPEEEVYITCVPIKDGEVYEEEYEEIEQPKPKKTTKRPPKKKKMSSEDDDDSDYKE